MTYEVFETLYSAHSVFSFFVLDSGADVFLFDGGIRENPQILLWGKKREKEGEERGLGNLPHENTATEQKGIREHSQCE